MPIRGSSPNVGNTVEVGEIAELAKGSGIFGDGAGAPREVTVGANDTVLMADSGQSAGVKWGKEKRRILYRIVEKATDVAAATSVGGDLRLPFACTITDVGAYKDTAGTTGTMVVDVNKNGSTLMSSNKISIASGQKSSEDGGATQPVITTTSYAAHDILTFDVDAIHTTPGKGLTVWLEVTPS